MQNQNTKISKDLPLHIGLSWDFFQGQKVDLDISCVLLDYISEIVDCVYFNQLASKCGSIKHSGDQQKGDKTGYDEEMHIDLRTLDNSIKCLALIISAYNGEGFSNVETASAIVSQNNLQILSLPVGAMGKDNSCLLCFIYRDNIYSTDWNILNVMETSPEKNFMECEQLIKKALDKHQIIDQGLIMEGKNWKVGSGKTINMNKGQILQLPSDFNNICLGLGWDTHLDLDSSILCFDVNNNLKEYISFSKLKNSNQSIVHMGDNRTGVGSGDDETIIMNLQNIPSDITQIWCTINVFTQYKQFDDVKGAYCRIYDKKSNQQFCRVNLSKNLDNISNGCIVASFQRYTNSLWTFAFREYWTKQTQTYQQMTKIIEEINNKDFSKIKTIDEKGNIIKGYADGINSSPQSQRQLTENVSDDCCILI